MPTFDDVVASMSTARPPLSADKQQRALMLLRTLAEGEPVSAAALAGRTGLSPHEASRFIDSLPGVDRDDRDRVIGVWGLTVAHMPPHRYRLRDRDLFTWCAWDPFLVTPLLGGHVTVASKDARTGEAVGFRLTDDGVTELSHPGLTLSFTLPDEWTDDVIASFCHFIHFFTSEESARAWTRTHPETSMLPLEDAMALADVWRRQVTAARAGRRRPHGRMPIGQRAEQLATATAGSHQMVVTMIGSVVGCGEPPAGSMVTATASAEVMSPART